MKLNREQVLQELKSVLIGTSVKEIVEQSSRFVFSDGQVMTFNDEIACRAPTTLKIEGAVKAKKLITFLSTCKEELLEFKISKNKSQLMARGKHESMGWPLDADVTLPIDVVDKPDKWTKLSEGWKEAFDFVQGCAGIDESLFTLTCIHVTPQYLEAGDNAQVCRFRMKTGVSCPVLVRRQAMSQIVTLPITHIGQADQWLHFKQDGGGVIACRIYHEKWNNTDELFQNKGKPIHFPKDIHNAVKRTALAMSDDLGTEFQTILLQPGRCIINARGEDGTWRKDKRKLKYDGPAIQFNIMSSVLSYLSKNYETMKINPKRLQASGPNFKYVAALYPTEAE